MLFTETMSIGERLLNSIAITILGMTVVFVVLIIIAYSLEILRIMFKEKDIKEKEAPVRATEPVHILTPVTQENVEDIDLLLLITAAIAAEEDSSTEDFFVRSIKPTAQ